MNVVILIKITIFIEYRRRLGNLCKQVCTIPLDFHYLCLVERFRGMVVGGRRLGFPTANVVVRGGIAGVYAARVLAVGKWWNAMVNINNEGLLEAHLFDFEGDLYGHEIEVELVGFIRSEQKFGSHEELRAAIEQDRQTICEHLRASSATNY